MMTEQNWKDLHEAFREEEPWWENEYAGEEEFEKLDLYNWLECEGARPNYKMMEEFSRRGYDVFPVEKDSFGWLVGGIREKLVYPEKVICFG